MFKFEKESIIVKSWVSLIMAGTYKLEEVPNLFNLKNIVTEVIKELTVKTEQ